MDVKNAGVEKRRVVGEGLTPLPDLKRYMKL